MTSEAVRGRQRGYATRGRFQIANFKFQISSLPPGAGGRRAGIAGIVLVLGAGLFGCKATLPEARPGQDPVYAEAEAAYLGGNYAAARAAYTRFLGTKAAPPYAPEVYLRIGTCYLKEGEPGPALEALRRGLSDAAFPWLAAEILAAQGDAYRLSGDLRRAESAYRRALETSARDVREAEVRRNLAGVLARLGRWDEARQEFRTIAARFPASPQAPFAAERAALPDRSFWVEVGVYPDADQARRRARELQTRGLSATVAPLLAEGRALQTVRVGPFDTYGTAENAAQTCRAQGVDATVVP